MTERLYLDDPYLSCFQARVLAVRDFKGRPAVELDRSAFYPEGGGQPGDRGTLSGAQVLDTQEEAGAVLHLLDRALERGAQVEGQVDEVRRLDHLQQHHGQHLLSAAFERELQAPTVSFHLGEKHCSIDLDASISLLDDRSLFAVQAAANQSVWRNLPVVARDFSAQERAGLKLRKEPVKGDRVVVVEGVDASPCGGTHPRRTAEVGAIAILRAQRWGQGKARIDFVCGGRVVRLLGELQAVSTAAAEVLRCAPAGLPQAARRAVAEAHAHRKANETLLGELAGYEAARLAALGPGVVVARVERGAAMARAVAVALAAQGRTALIASIEAGEAGEAHEAREASEPRFAGQSGKEGDKGRAHLCFSRPKGPGPDLGQLIREVLARLHGKGGGSADFAQGSGEPLHLDEALAFAHGKLLEAGRETPGSRQS